MIHFYLLFPYSTFPIRSKRINLPGFIESVSPHFGQLLYLFILIYSLSMIDSPIKKSKRTNTSRQSCSKFRVSTREFIDQVYTDTTGLKEIKAKSTCLPTTERIIRKGIHAAKLSQFTVDLRTKTKNKSNDKSNEKQSSRSIHKQEGIRVSLRPERNGSLPSAGRSLEKKIGSDRKRKKWDQTKTPYPWQTVLQDYNELLSAFEQVEVKEYKKIYYIGHNVNVKEKKREEQFDTEQKQYNFVMNDHIAYRFEILGMVGKGSYGQVFRVWDHKKREEVAVKMVKSRSKFTKQALIEDQILTHIKENDPESLSNIIKIKDFVIFRNHVCMVFELMSQNLYDLIIRNNYNGFKLDLIRRFAVQILVSLQFLRKHRIIHCDIKPENILLKEFHKSGIKIIDFGSSCFDNQTIYTYIQSRYYRAPEITFGLPYSNKIDVWSTGCIMGQLYTGVPLFPGENQREQIKYLVDTLGLPDKEMMHTGQRSSLFFSKKDLKPEIKQLKTIDYFSQKFDERIPDADFREFLLLFLRWNPKDRPTPQQLLKHHWIKEGLPSNLKVNDLFFDEAGKRKTSQSKNIIRISKSKEKKPIKLQMTASNHLNSFRK